jgi:hypothetical protein
MANLPRALAILNKDVPTHHEPLRRDPSIPGLAGTGVPTP